MLTRSAVANRLQCSLATVRRLQGYELFPRRDARGVHLFDEEEVAEVARRFCRGEVSAARGNWLNGRRSNPLATRQVAVHAHPGEQGTAQMQELQRLRRQNERLARELAETKGVLFLLYEELETLD